MTVNLAVGRFPEPSFHPGLGLIRFFGSAFVWLLAIRPYAVRNAPGLPLVFLAQPGEPGVSVSGLNRFQRSLMNWITKLLCLLLLSACTKPENRETKAFRDKLADEILNAAFVEVVEHSDMADFPDHAFPNYPEKSSDDVPKMEYARLRLSADQKKNLLKRVKAFDEKDSPAVSFCGFVPHHTLEFHSSAGAVSYLEICFQCSTFYWSAGELTGSPGEWVDEFESFISEIGLRPDADWRDLVARSGKLPPAR